MSKKLPSLIILLCLHLTLFAQAPKSFAGKEITAGLTASVPIRVTDFHDIGAISLRLCFDENLVAFTGISGSAFPNFQAGSDSGCVFIGWITDGISPAPTLPDGDTLLFVEFVFINPGTSPLVWTDNGISCEFAGFPLIAPLSDTPTDQYYFDGWVSTLKVVFDRNYNTGALIAIPQDGQAPYTLSWTAPGGFSAGNTSTVYPPGNGYYTVHVTDALGAEGSFSYYYGPVHNTDTKLDYPSIQEAIDAPETLDGHHILADPGVYLEMVSVYKSLRIQGSGAAQSRVSSATNSIFTITADNVIIEDFEISHSGIVSPGNNGLRLVQVQGAIIRNNLIKTNYCGIKLENADLNEITQNEILLNEHSGILLEGSSENEILDNVISGHSFAGIHLFANISSSALNTINDNEIHGNLNGILLEDDEGGAQLTGNVAGNQISNNLIYNNTQSGLKMLQTPPLEIAQAELNWWGDATGPYHSEWNPCGKGNAAIGNVDFDPWWWEDSRVHFNGLARPDYQSPEAIQSLPGVPFILRDTLLFTDYSDYHPDILMDIALRCHSPAFPSGMRLIRLRSQLGNGPISDQALDYELSSDSVHLLSAITGIAAEALQTYANASLTLEFWMEGADNEMIEMPFLLETLTYEDPDSCISPAGNTDTILLSFREMIAFDAQDRAYLLCDTFRMAFEEAFPVIRHSGAEILSDARIRIISPFPVPAGSRLDWSTSFGNGSYDILLPTSEIFLSEILGMSSGNPLLNESEVTRQWNFTLSGPDLFLNEYDLVLEGLAQTPDSDYVYASDTILLRNLPQVQLDPLSDIASVAGGPIRFLCAALYPTLDEIPTDIKADLKITASQAFPAGMQLLSIQRILPGDTSDFILNYDLGTKTEVSLGEIQGMDAPVMQALSQDEVEWIFTLSSPLTPWTADIDITPIAHSAAGVCQSISGSSASFNVSLELATLNVKGIDSVVCRPAPLQFESSIHYPPLFNVDTAIKADVLITSQQYFPTGTSIRWYYNTDQDSGTFVLASFRNQIRLSEIVGGQSPNSLQGHSGTDTWRFVIETAGIFPLSEMRVEALCLLDQSDYPYAEDVLFWQINNCHIFGFVHYNNTAKSPLGDVCIHLWKEGILIDSTTSLSNGYYAFSNLSQGMYSLEAASDREGSSINATDAGALNLWQVSISPTNPLPLEKVNFLAGDVAMPATILTSFDAFNILNYYVSGETEAWNLPGKEDWVFWKAGDILQQNLWQDGAFPVIEVTNSSVGQNLYGMRTGDFNRSYVPATKGEAEKMMLTESTVQHCTLGGLNEIPLCVGQNLEIGAISLTLVLPSGLKAENIYIKDRPADQVLFAQQGQILRIGWTTLTPLMQSPGDTLLMLALRSKASYPPPGDQSFHLIQNALNEFADAQFSPYPLIEISLPLLTFQSADRTEPALLPASLRLFPNPADERITLQCSLTAPVHLSFRILNPMGQVMMTRDAGLQAAGNCQHVIDLAEWPPGLYLLDAILRNDQANTHIPLQFIKIKKSLSHRMRK